MKQQISTDSFAQALGNGIVEQASAPQSDLGSGLKLSQEIAESWGNRDIPDAPVARTRLDSLIADGENVKLSANSVKTDQERLAELFYPKDGVRAGFPEGLPMLAAGPGYNGGLPAMPSAEIVRSLVNDALDVKQMRNKPLDEQRDVLNQLIDARRGLGTEADVDSQFAKGLLSREEYRENMNMRNALGNGIRMQFSNTKTTGAIDPGLYREEMEGWGGGAINFGCGLRSMGSRFSLRIDSAKANGATALNAESIRVSQKSVSYLKQRFGDGSYSYDDLVTSMIKKGWNGNPIDVVTMPDGKFTSIDNTRVLAARDARIDVQANVRDYSESLPQEMLRRFENPNIPGDYAKTWGQAVEYRVQNQGKKFSTANPYGTFESPVMKYKVKNWFGL